MKTLNQNERILRHLSDHGSITTLDAFNEYGITRLASRICDLRQAGHPIQGQFESSTNRYGEKVSYVRYSLGAN